MDEFRFAGIYPIFFSEAAIMNLGSSSTTKVGLNGSVLFKFWTELKHNHFNFQLAIAVFVCAGLCVDKITAELALRTSPANKRTEKRKQQKYSVVKRLGRWRSFQPAEVG